MVLLTTQENQIFSNLFVEISLNISINSTLIKSILISKKNNSYLVSVVFRSDDKLKI
jgi:hypothetical protein